MSRSLRATKESAVKGVEQLAEGRNFRRLVSSMDALRCGWSCEVIEQYINVGYGVTAGVGPDSVMYIFQYTHCVLY